jgi:hypothetical protein
MHRRTRSGTKLTRRLMIAIMGSAALLPPRSLLAEHDGT